MFTTCNYLNYFHVVRVGRPVTKLLWIVHDMAEKKLLMGGLDKLVDIALKHKNFALSYKLADILLTEGGKIEEKSFCKLLKLAVNTEAEEDVLSCAKIGQKLGLLTNEVLKKQIFPNLHNWPELVVTSLEDVGVERKATVTPLIEWLIGQGKTEAASTLAGIFSEHVDNKLKFFTQTSKNVGAVCNHFHENTTANQTSTTAPAEPKQPEATSESSPQTLSTPIQSSPNTVEGPSSESVNIASLSQAELEAMLAARTASPATRGQAYLRLLEIFHAAGAVDQAIQVILSFHLSFRHKCPYSKSSPIIGPYTKMLMYIS